MTKMYKAQIVQSILKADPNVETVDIQCVNGEQVAFWTKDLASDEENGTGYYSDEGYDWDKFKGLSKETLNLLSALKIASHDVMFNDCEGSENEGAVII